MNGARERFVQWMYSGAFETKLVILFFGAYVRRKHWSLRYVQIASHLAKQFHTIMIHFLSMPGNFGIL